MPGIYQLDRDLNVERDGGPSSAPPIEDGCEICGTTDGPLTLIAGIGAESVICDECWEKGQLAQAA